MEKTQRDNKLPTNREKTERKKRKQKQTKGLYLRKIMKRRRKIKR